MHPKVLHAVWIICVWPYRQNFYRQNFELFSTIHITLKDQIKPTAHCIRSLKLEFSVPSMSVLSYLRVKHLQLIEISLSIEGSIISTLYWK